MQFLADEDVPMPSIHRLRDLGYDVEAVVEDAPGTPDADVLARAVHDERILITRDRDFGRLVIREGRPAPPGLIYGRDSGADPLAVRRFVAALLEHDGETIVDMFTVLKARQHRSIRLRPSP